MPYAFTLRLTPEAIKAANDNSRGILDKLRRDAVRCLKKELATLPDASSSLEILIGLGWDSSGLHVHGSFACKPHELEAVRAALTRAGGDWQGPGKQFQLRTPEMYNADGWASYIAGNMRGAKPYVEGKLWSVTSGARRRGRDMYDSLRNRMCYAASAHRRRSREKSKKQ